MTETIINTPIFDYEGFYNKLAEPKLSKNSLTVLEKRYLRRDSDNKIAETPKQLFARVSWAVSEPELEYGGEPARIAFANKVYHCLANGKFMFNSPALFNLGTNNGLGASACYVLVPDDSLESIMDTCKNLALIQKAGGGVGYNFSNLRPKGSMVASCAATTDGPLPFIDMYCAATNAIQQGAKRRGAQMGLLSINHPDVWDFIQAKSDLNRWQNMNVSLVVTNEWMNLLKTKPHSPHTISHPKWGEGYLVMYADGSVKAFKDTSNTFTREYKVISVGELFEEICKRAWTTGEPGLVFQDRINQDWVFSNSGINKIEGTNPCGEQPLENGGNCTLASINLSAYYDQSTQTVNYSALKNDVQLMQHALDNIVSINKFPVDLVTRQNQKTRRIGGGVMGWADLLFKMNLPYDSGFARDLARNIMSSISLWSLQTSKALAKQRGSFEDFDKSNYTSPVRNAYRNTIAPTGTISIIADCSGGIEPAFSLAFIRQVLQDENGNRTKMQEVNKEFSTALTSFLAHEETSNSSTYDKIIEYVASNGTLKGYVDTFTDSNRWKYLCQVFVTAKDIDMKNHVLMQAAWQEHVDTAISKTINLNNSATVHDVKEAYILAFNTGCKGITVYRDGSRDGVAGMVQPMQLKKIEPSIPKIEDDLSSVIAKRVESDTIESTSMTKIVIDTNRFSVDPSSYIINNNDSNISLNKSSKDQADVFNCLKVKQITPMGNLHVVLVMDQENKPLEIFAQISKAGEQPAADLEAICRLASVFLRNGGAFDEVIKQVEHIGSSELTPSKDGQVKSLPDGLGLALKKIRKYLINDNKLSTIKLNVQDTKIGRLYKKVCPICMAHLVMQEGCNKCSNPSCDYSKC